MTQAILAAIAALPSLVKLLVELVKFFESKWGDSWPSYVADLGNTFTDLNEAKTPEQKQEVAAKLAKLATRWGQE